MAKEYNKFLTQYLVMWEQSGESAPENEIQSIQAWLSFLGQHGAEETKKVMRNRLILLGNAAVELYEAGPEAEDEVGVYKNRPDLRDKSRMLLQSNEPIEISPH